MKLVFRPRIFCTKSFNPALGLRKSKFFYVQVLYQTTYFFEPSHICRYTRILSLKFILVTTGVLFLCEISGFGYLHRRVILNRMSDFPLGLMWRMAGSEYDTIPTIDLSLYLHRYQLTAPTPSPANCEQYNHGARCCH